MAAVNHKDTYKASAVFLIVMGMLYLIDKFIGFASHGLPWVMQKDNLLLYAAVIFLWFKADKSVGIVLAGIWLILNISLGDRLCWGRCLLICCRRLCCC